LTNRPKGFARADLGGAVDEGLELDLGDEILVIVVDLAGLVGLLVVLDDRESALQIAELDRRVEVAHPQEEAVGELGHVPGRRLARQGEDRRADQGELARVGLVLVVDRAQLAGPEAGVEPGLEGRGGLLVLGEGRDLGGR